MKVLLVTTPIRPTPTNFPPFGSLSIIKYLRKNGVADVSLYDIDCLRPSFDEAVAEIVRRRPDVLGISAVVSTAYRYTRDLSLAVKKLLPDTLIVVGGNMAASAEILLRKTGADLCVTGEGEIAMLEIVRRAAETRDPTGFAQVPGLMLLDKAGALVNSGFPPSLLAREIYDIDWDDLVAGSRIEHFFPKAATNFTLIAEKFNHDARLAEPARRAKSFSYLYTSKGCVSRCTFCHRFDKGLRQIPLDLVFERLEEMVRRFELGFLFTADENFGADKRLLGEFCERVKPLDLIWGGGSRVTGMTPELVGRMRDAGCAHFSFGIESGSEKILQVMEKKTTVQQNLDAIRLTHEAGMPAPIALVLGMPGESPATVRESIEMCKYGKSLSPEVNPNNLSINYAQALPGTPLYEYARHKGLIGKDLDGEEGYLLSISDRDAHDEHSTLNFTDYSTLELQTWRPLITIEVNHHFVKTFGLDQYRRVALADMRQDGGNSGDTGFHANPKRLLEQARDETRPESGGDRSVPVPPPLMDLMRRGQFGLAMICYPELFYRLRALLPLLVLLKSARKFGARYAAGLLAEHLRLKLAGPRGGGEAAQSLRKLLDKTLGDLPGDNPAMLPLRKGR